ncbi:hypothetical protein ASE74_01085 [Pedobacter sp. Leaf216]|uniref:ORC-CDC6 family AAA ATPase n=1 Tax=Pedobacter sp. Leaf216 TaxID=1735684 RepID=UPI0006FEA9EF|nr:hypothetical protein [Pedobacter sp. Leaf216]KQM79193.1 hypothetical protein ASE74_01085 [Pedobacter sp. Leaf216]
MGNKINTVNPFNITKAVDYSDEEINRYWVDLPEGNGFVGILKPSSPMPMIILGGKGSGKTHIMRYFSYNLQKIRYGKKFIDEIKKDKYIGIFLRCGGLNSSKFYGNGEKAEAWKNIFAYYLELWFTQLLTNIISEIFETYPDHSKPYEKNICDALYKLFDADVIDGFETLHQFSTYLQKLQKEVDYEVNNSVITGKKISDIRIMTSPGRLIFGFPRVLEKIIPYFEGVQFIFLIDEYENLMEYQQQYVNTLIRERESPVSFRVGARWYGVKTFNTNSGNEELKVGSEYEQYIIDNLLRSGQGYDKFAREICISRLKQSGISVGEDDKASNSLSSFFEEFNLGSFFYKLKTKELSLGKSYLFNLERNLLARKIPGETVIKIIRKLSYDVNPLLERTNVFLFYRSWKTGKDLEFAANEIAKDCEAFTKEQDKSLPHSKVLEKFRNDLIDQLHRESREALSYCGIEKIIKMSSGIPRHLLIMLKHIYRWSIYNGEHPFGNERISENAQSKGIIDASSWFLEDARASGEDGKLMSTSIKRIGQYLQEIRFSDIPPECSLSSFSIKLIDIDDNINKTLQYLEHYSYLIRISTAREKNSAVQRIGYQINGLLAPQWELPIYRRGILHLTTDEVKAIFGTTSDQEYNRIKNSRLVNYNAPFRISNNPTLFEI